jgi:hypothetical protein
MRLESSSSWKTRGSGGNIGAAYVANPPRRVHVVVLIRSPAGDQSACLQDAGL